MEEQRFATVHKDGKSLLRVVLEYVGLPNGRCLGFRVNVLNLRPEELDDLVGEREMQVAFFEVDRQQAAKRTYLDAYAWGMRLSGVMECDYQDNAWAYVEEI